MARGRGFAEDTLIEIPKITKMNGSTVIGVALITLIKEDFNGNDSVGGNGLDLGVGGVNHHHGYRNVA